MTHAILAFGVVPLTWLCLAVWDWLTYEEPPPIDLVLQAYPTEWDGPVGPTDGGTG